ncbi:uncharacterized protein Fot_46354 [Forsythia ovata]|uniref:DUF936 domain-containing protein n=1 Tax=Forsythia ovata TaxID=205694 RepID=A0ABD1QM78_9LAMI
MDSLKTGVLVELIEDVQMNEKGLEQKPALLQIRSIIPVLEEDDSGKPIKIGQFVYLKELDKSHPVPLLIDITPFSRRHMCEGTPEDIISPPNLLELLETPTVDSINEKGVILEKKISENSSDSRKLTWII